ncbi:MAG: DUF4253 domain-containing protein [Deferribacteraceae bacterium]|jgi:hypothetical protein|nr:DUF4253 domain-containing protein [Deferribacteraceae bacterium]
MTEDCKKIIDLLACDYELLTDSSKGQARWQELSEQGKRDGFIPLIINTSDILAESLELALEDAELDESPAGMAQLRESILKKMADVDVASYLGERFQEYTEEMHSDEDILGEFNPDIEGFSDDFISYDGCEELIIAKIPTANPWELAAWLPMGGFNDCPSPAAQAAVFRYWYEKYGAVPAVVSYDIWEMAVTKPPTTDNDAEALAKEHFAFCYDIVMQVGEELASIRGRASCITDAKAWYFWWD